MPRKGDLESSNNNIKNSKVKINEMHKLDEEDDDGYPPILYDENIKYQDSDSSDDDFLRQKIQRRKQDQQQSSLQNQTSIDNQKIGTKASLYARAQQQQQMQTASTILRKTSLENIQDKLKLQIERKLKMKESLNPSQLTMMSRQKIDEESKKNTKVNIPESLKGTQTNIALLKKASTIMSAKGSQILISDVVSQNSVKNSMAEIINLQFKEMSQARIRDMETKKMKQQELDIKEDKTLTEDQRKIKLDNLKHSLIVDRVKNIIEKTKKMKEQQYKPAKREQRFEMALNIFKKLDTYLETKGYLQKEEMQNQIQQKALQNGVKKEKNNMAKKGKNAKIFDSSQTLDASDEQQYQYIKNILQKTYRFLNKNNEQILQQDQILCGSLLQELERNILGQNFQPEEDELEERKRFSKRNYENISSTENQSDTNAFYNILQYQLESGYFSKVDLEKNKTDESSVLESASSDEKFRNDPMNEQNIVENKKNSIIKKDQLEEYRKKAKKITKLLIHTSRNILKKNIEENNLAILQARKARVNQKIQQQINIRYLEKSIKKLPRKLQNQLNMQTGEINSGIKENNDKIELKEKQEEEKERNRLMNEMLPEISRSQRKNVDTKLKELEESLSSLNTSSMVSQDVQKIRNSFERRFSINNEQKGITVPAQKQSKFSRNHQATQLNGQNQEENLILPMLQDGYTSEVSPISSPIIKKVISTSNKTSKSIKFSDNNEFDGKNESKPVNSIQNKDISFGRIRKQTEDSTLSKNSLLKIHQKQDSLILNGNRSPISQLNQTAISTQGSPVLGLSTYSKLLSKEQIRLKSNTFNSIFQKDKKLNEKIIKSIEQKGFNVMDIKQIVHEIKEKEEMSRTKNKFSKLDLNNNQSSQVNKLNKPTLSFSEQFLKPLNKQNDKINQSKLNEINVFVQQDSKNIIKTPNKNNNTATKVNQDNFDIFSSIRSQLSEKLIPKQVIPDNIFLTENQDFSPTKKSEKNLIYNFLPLISSKRSISASNDKIFQNSKAHEPEFQTQRQLSHSSSQSINLNPLAETNKQLEQIMSNINNFKISYKSEKGYFHKQISEMQLKLEKQQKNVTPQPLESLRMCFGQSTPYASRTYVYDRKAVQKIL